MSDNRDFRLPSGAMVTLQTKYGEREYYVWTGRGPIARLTARDVEVLYADSIADNGGRELPAPPPRDRCVSCGDPISPNLCADCAS